MRTLSKKDRRFPRKAEIIDGLIVEIRDTDDDPDADFYVYIGSKRIAKHKGVRIGEARQVPGRSGRAYDLVLLAVIDSQQTIRLGVRPASPAPRARR
ncbi:MAG: hypothetical protein JXQ73_00185 [Phycisphaerae bacterium]|nr:hypothetical protein [Phycisphaerae bacterium]